MKKYILILMVMWFSASLSALGNLSTTGAQNYTGFFAGTITVSGTTVTGVGTNFKASGGSSPIGVSANDRVWAISGSTWTFVGVVQTGATSGTSLTLVSSGPSIASGQSYIILPGGGSSSTFTVTISNNSSLTVELPINDSLPIGLLDLGTASGTKTGALVVGTTANTCAVNIKAITCNYASTITLNFGKICLYGNLNPTITNLTWSLSTTAGTFEYLSNSTAQNILGTTYFNLTLNGQTKASYGIKTTLGAITVNGTLSVNAGTLDMSTFSLTNSAGTISNSGTLKTSSSFTTSSASIGGTVEFALGGNNIPSKTYVNLTCSNTSLTNTALGAITVTGVLTIASGGTVAMGTNVLTLSSTSTLTNNGTISTTATTNWVVDSRSSGSGTYIGTITFAGTSAQTIQSGAYANLTVSGAGVKTIASAVTVSKILTTTASGGAVSINSSGSLTLSGTLSGTEWHVIDGPIECNGGDFIVTGQKDQGTNLNPFMRIRTSITDISSSGAGRVGCIQFKPSNTGNVVTKRSVFRFVGSSLALGNTLGAGDRSIVTNDRAYFEIGDGSTTTALTLNDTFTIFNGLRLRSSSTLSSNSKLKLGSSSTNKFGGSSFNGFIDTVDATGTVPVYNGNVSLIMTMEGSRKFRFLGNPFSGSLNITDFTDNIDITGTIGTNTNNFTSTNTNSPSAFLYTSSSNSWTALTSSSPTSLSSLEGLRVLVRGAKGEGLTVGSGSYTPSVARIEISGAPIIGNKTISNLSFNSSNSNGYNLVTNPLLAPVDLGLLYNAGSGLTNVSSTVTIYTPSLSGMKTYDLSTGNWSGGGSTKGDVWLPGSSIIFQVTSATNSILVEDLDKLTPLGRTYTSMFAELDSVKNIGQFLISSENGRLSLTDGVSLDFGNRKDANDSYNFGIDAEDFGTDSVNLSLISPEGKYLTISKTNSLKDNEIRRYPMSVSMRNSSLNGNYKMTFELFKAFETGYQIILLDKYLNISTDLFVNPFYDFKITDDVNSKGDSRFEIVVSKSQLGIQDIVNSKVVDFFINQDFSQNVLSFSFTGTSSNHELLIFDVQGKQVYSRDCQNESVILSSDKFKPGVYFASVRSGDVTKTKKFILVY